VLVVDDDVELCELVSEYLTREGFNVEAVHDGTSVADRALSGNYGIVVLDVMLPRLGGLDVLRRIRAHSRMPVLMLTARGDDVDRIVGLELGADDYLPKPFNPRELVARIRAILRRAAPAAEAASDDLIAVDDVELLVGSRAVHCAGSCIDLTSVEFELLRLLLQAAGRVVTREELSRAVLGREFSPYDRSVDVHVSNLRKKLGERPDGAERIKSVRGVGYIYTRSQ
jgi:two-component system response regulator CpxR